MRSGLVSKTTLGASRVKTEGSSFENVDKWSSVEGTSSALKPDVANCINREMDLNFFLLYLFP